jgi:hypothetical protein
MKVLLLILLGLLKGERLYENHEVRLLKNPYPFLVIKSTNCKLYKLVVNGKNAFVLKENQIIFKARDIFYREKYTMNKKSQVKEGIYDVLGRRLGGKFWGKGIYFRVSNTRKKQKTLILK